MQQEPRVLGRIGRLLQQADFHQVLRRHRQRDRIADRFVEAVIGAVAEQERLLVIGALIEVVTQLVMDGREILACNIDAHFDAQVFYVVDVPGAGVTHHLAIARLHE